MNYITETLFSYYNDGFTPIKYQYSYEKKVTSKFSISSTGTIGIKVDSTGKKFKNGLTASLKLEVSSSKDQMEDEKYKIDLEVDPKTQVNLYKYGEGKISNGVASRYTFWIRSSQGAFEVFSITTQYYRLEKKRI